MRRSFGPNRSRRMAPRRKESGIDPSRFVRKATVKAPQDAYVPSFTYADLDIDPRLKANILKKGYVDPTPIQDQSIHTSLEGKDVLGIANTGTGKTAAFLIPLIHGILHKEGMRVLILVPTREIAVQIHDEFLAFSHNLHLRSSVCLGGVAIGRQIASLRLKPHFVIATPGRLKDLHMRRALNMNSFTHIVLDEADRMVDMGFIADIKFLLSLLPTERQSLFFSATMPPEVKDLIHSFLKDPVTISVRQQDTSANIDQDVIRILPTQKKIDVLSQLLEDTKTFNKVLIFGRTKRGVDRIGHTLYDRGFAVVAIHGDMPQSKRQKALELFKQNRVQILVATDVASRGLDIPNVSHVINFDIPNSYEDYVHRIGRTGRADKTGKALTLID